MNTKVLLGIMIAFLLSVPTGGIGEADLTVKGITFIPQRPQPNEMVRIIATIMNQGNEDVETSFDVRFKINDKLLVRRRVHFGLRAGKKRDIEIQWKAIEGSHRITVEVDLPFGRVEESDERNNVLEATITVKRQEAIQSITDDLISSIGGALEEVGKALINFNPQEKDPFKILDGIAKEFEAAGVALTEGADEISLITKGLPPVLAAEEQIVKGKAIERSYRQLADSFEASKESLERWDIKGGASSLKGIEEGLIRLSAMGFGKVDLKGLGEAARHISQAGQIATKIEQSLASDEDKLEELIGELLLSLVKTGHALQDVGAAVETLKNSVTFTSPQGNPIVEYKAGDVLIITAREKGLKLKIFTQEGKVVLQKSTAANVLKWDGKDDQGALLRGVYFYRLTIAGKEVKLGKITIS
jgi:hypothetical protein